MATLHGLVETVVTVHVRHFALLERLGCHTHAAPEAQGVVIIVVDLGTSAIAMVEIVAVMASHALFTHDGILGR